MKKHIGLLVFVLVVLPILKVQALSIAPPTADPWFTFEYKPDLSKLPSGFFVGARAPYENSGSLLLYNDTDIPLYVVQYNDPEKKVYENSELPENYKPVFKLTRDRWYFFHDYNPNTSKYVGHDQSEWASEQANYIPLQQLYWKFFKDTKNVYQDDRPIDVVVPKSEVFNILLLYKGEEIKFPVEVVYSLNESYDPGALKKATKNFNQTYSNDQTKVNLLYFLIPIIGLITIFMLTKRRKNKIQNITQETTQT